MNAPLLRLTALAHGGGCGCKLAPSVLRHCSPTNPDRRLSPLLVGTETGDDAAVGGSTTSNVLIATTDFFTPIVDDARDFGRIAAANALSRRLRDGRHARSSRWRSSACRSASCR